MAEKFECDRCHHIFPADAKWATLELAERDAHHLPHKFFKRKLDLCKPCFDTCKKMFDNILSFGVPKS